MNYPVESVLLSKLKQSIIDKEYSYKFTELMNTNIRINKDQNHTQMSFTPSANSLLPSISNAKISLAQRIKSHSQRKLSIKHAVSKDKNKNQLSDKNISIQGTNRKLRKSQMQTIIRHKQSVGDFSKNNTGIRNKILSFKTPLKNERNQPTTGPRSNSFVCSDKQRNMHLKQFTQKIEKLNEDIVLSIKGGNIDEENWSYKKFMTVLNKIKQNNESEYDAIQGLTAKIKKFILKFKIINGLVQCKHLLELSTKKNPSNFELLTLFANKEEICQAKYIPGLQFYTHPQMKGKNLAAAKITSIFRMNKAKQFCAKLKSLMNKVKTIQRYWRMCLLIKRHRTKMMAAINGKIDRYNSLQSFLCKNWPIIKTSQRVEVHLCSYSLEQFKRITIKNVKQKQNSHISRIFKALQTDVLIIYVAPLEISQEVMKYYQSILNFNPSKIQQKIYFITPENMTRLQQYSNLTTTSLLLYSPKALRRIRQIIGNKYAYIVPSYPSMQYINLAAELNIPVLSFQQSLCKLYSTKSGCQTIFKAIAKREKSPIQITKSIQSIFSEKQLIHSLAVLIFKNKNVKVWYLKIEDQINSRGLAYLNINKISFLRELCSSENQFVDVEEKEMIKLVVEELNNKLRHRLKIINKDIYANYHQFISHFLTRGGIIQACPESEKITAYSISFFIDPVGQFYIIGTYNKLELGGKSICQAIKFPSTLHIDYECITRCFYKELWVKMKFFGYFTVDLLYLEDKGQSYAIGIDCFLNEKTASLYLMNFCANTKYSKDKNMLLNIQQEQFHYIYCPSVSLFNLPHMNAFFKNCKYQNISFDLQQKLGTIFILLDNLQTQQIGFLCMDNSLVNLLNEVKKVVQYFSKEFRKGKNSNDQIGLLKGVITTWLKRYEKNLICHQTYTHFALQP